jgi:glycosyltransferase involved in cell wall biosynthesis/predicted Zn-dependent protease
VDEIVVVDTGSTDESVAIAESFGAKVGHFVWCDDFSAARNASLELATSDWVLVIDADEALDVRDPGHWRMVLTGPVDAVALSVANVMADGAVESEAQVLRLFKRRDGVRFAGRLHESVLDSVLAAGGSVGDAPFLTLRHTGYRPEVVAAGAKGARNVRLAELAVAERPDDAASWLDLARSLAFDRRPAEALAAFERLSALPNGLEGLDDRRWIYAVQALQATYQDLGRTRDAESTLDRALSRLPGFPEFLFARAGLRQGRGDTQGASDDYRACLAAHGRHFPVSVRPGLTDTLPTRALQALGSPTVSACLIVKNEAANLPRCLASLKGWVDEIVVVDTGSTDESVAIAESFGAKVGHFVWCDDFSAARNASLELATSDWVLVIDADEALDVRDPGHWRQALAARRAYHLEIRNVDVAGRIESRTESFPRLFPRDAQVRFRGRLHENPLASLQAMGLAAESLESAWLNHSGYTDAAIAQNDKLARNQALVERMIAEDPRDPEAWLFLANTRWLAKDAGATLQAIGELRILLAYGRPLAAQLQRTAFLVEAWALMAADRLADALSVLDFGLRFAPGFVELHFERGRARALSGELDGAIADFQACLAAPRGGLAAREGLTGYLAHAELVDLYVQQGRNDLAAEHLRAAAADPACPMLEAAHMHTLAERLTPAPAAAEPSMEPAVVALEQGRFEDAKAHAIRYLEAVPRSSEGFLVLTTAMLQLGTLDKALLAVSQAIGLEPTGSGYYLLGMVLLGLGQPGLAEKAFATVLQLDPDHPHAMAQRLACRNQRPEHALGEGDTLAIERLFAQARPTVSACLIVKNEASNLPRCLESLRGWVDEIVVVDTGSTDETVAIAESFGAKIGHFTWCDDFSAARNASLDLATSDWILAIDADEVLEVDDHEVWQRALRRRDLGCYAIHQCNVQENGEVLANPLVRIYQRHEAIRYEGRLHEDVTRAISRLNWPAAHLDGIRLRHDGYMAHQVEAKDKWARNFRLALAETEAQPESAVAWYNLGRTVLLMGQEQAGRDALSQVARLLEGGAELGESRLCTFTLLYANQLTQQGRPAEALKWLDDGLAQVPGFPEFHYERGRLRAAMGDRAGARADMEACLRPLTRAYLSAMREGIQTTLPRAALAELAAAQRA